MGWLSAPSAAVRAAFAPADPDGTPAVPRGRLGRFAGMAAPVAGAAVNLLVSLRFNYLGQLSVGVRNNINPAEGLRLVARAPAVMLVPELFGVVQAL